MLRLATCLVLLAAVAPEARPCSPPCGVQLVVPSGGEVPANLPALRWWYIGPPVTVDQVVRVTETLEDGTASSLPVERVSDDRGANYARFGRSLVPGASYRVEVATGCSSDTAYATNTFRAVAEAPFPDSLGVVTVAPRSVQGIAQVWTSSGSCTQEATVVARELRLTLSESAMPWRNALVSNWYHGEYLVSLLGKVFDWGPTDPEAYWKDWTIATPYHTCASDDRGIDPGAPEGTVEIIARATIPGSAHVIPEVAASFELVCDDPKNSYGPLDAWSSGGGCMGGLVSHAALALFMLMCFGLRARAHVRRWSSIGMTSTQSTMRPTQDTMTGCPIWMRDDRLRKLYEGDLRSGRVFRSANQFLVAMIAASMWLECTGEAGETRDQIEADVAEPEAPPDSDGEATDRFDVSDVAVPVTESECVEAGWSWIEDSIGAPPGGQPQAPSDASFCAIRCVSDADCAESGLPFCRSRGLFMGGDCNCVSDA